ncbi:O-methyltransferase [Serratia ureilytica]
MSTLTTAPLAPLLSRLFQQASRRSPALAALFRDVPDAEQSRLMQSKTEYRELYHRLKDFPLAVSPATGALLYMLARGCRAQNIVEFGTSFGISTLHLAAALRDNGGGRLITCEFEPSKAVQARNNLTEGGVVDLVEIRVGDALKRCATICRPRSICCCSTAPRDFTPIYSTCLRTVCGPAR